MKIPRSLIVVLFTNAFSSVPSCSPSRSAILSGQDFWRLGEAANLRGTLYKDLSGGDRNKLQSLVQYVMYLAVRFTRFHLLNHRGF